MIGILEIEWHLEKIRRKIIKMEEKKSLLKRIVALFGCYAITAGSILD
jgi:hypothetical protein